MSHIFLFWHTCGAMSCAKKSKKNLGKKKKDFFHNLPVIAKYMHKYKPRITFFNASQETRACFVDGNIAMGSVEGWVRQGQLVSA